MNQDELHEHYLDQLPTWAPDRPGKMVLARYEDREWMRFGWREGMRIVRSSTEPPFPWEDLRITAILTEDRSTWTEVPAEERERLGDNLIGCWVWSDSYKAVVSGVVESNSGKCLTVRSGWTVYADDSLRVHPADLATAREKAGPTPPTTLDDWEEGAKWVDCDDDVCVKRDGRTKVVGANGEWTNSNTSAPFRAPTEDELIRARHADERAGWAPPTNPDRWRDGDAWAWDYADNVHLYRKKGAQVECVMLLGESSKWKLSEATVKQVTELSLRPLTDEERARVDAADEAELASEGPTGDVLVKDRCGHLWSRYKGRWFLFDSPVINAQTWDDLNLEYGPLTVYRPEKS